MTTGIYRIEQNNIKELISMFVWLKDNSCWQSI
jgi:hypothetical protein